MSRSKKDNNPIALELGKYDKKVREFQQYLEDRPITSIADDSVRHKEIDVQLKMMEKLPFYLSEIKKLKTIVQEGMEKMADIMGDNELSPIEQGLV